MMDDREKETTAAEDALERLDNAIYSEFGNTPIGMTLQNDVNIARTALKSNAEMVKALQRIVEHGMHILDDGCP